MKISNLGACNTTVPSSSLRAGENGSSIAGGTDKNGYTPSTELTQLTHLSRQTPEIRDDRVQAALQRLRAGDYHTHASAEKTAAAMMQA